MRSELVKVVLNRPLGNADKDFDPPAPRQVSRRIRACYCQSRQLKDIWSACRPRRVFGGKCICIPAWMPSQPPPLNMYSWRASDSVVFNMLPVVEMKTSALKGLNPSAVKMDESSVAVTDQPFSLAIEFMSSMPCGILYRDDETSV